MLRYHIFYNDAQVHRGSSTIKKAHQFLTYAEQDSDIQLHNIVYIDAIQFIQSNKDNDSIVIAVYWTNTLFCVNLLKYLTNHSDPILMKIVFITFDYWPREHRSSATYKNFVSRLFYAENHYVITFAHTIEQLNDMWNDDFDKYRSKIFFKNMWCCYDSSFIEYNSNPINKVALSGRIIADNYPERLLLQNCNHPCVVILSYLDSEKLTNNYNIRLNKYLCCFASSVYVYHKKSAQYKNTHILLLKVFEILSAGSLLLCPNTEEKYLNSIGLYDHINCIICDMSKINKTIDYITNPINKKIIDKLRKSGQKHGSTNLNSKKKYSEIKDLLAFILKSDKKTKIR